MSGIAQAPVGAPAPVGVIDIRTGAELAQVVTDDEVVLPLQYYLPEQKASRPPVALIFAALGVRPGYYHELARLLAAHGVIAVLVTLRGQAGSSVDVTQGDNFGFREILDFDFPAVLGATRTRFPDSDFFLLGHSAGGVLSALYAATSAEPEAIRGVITIASGSTNYRHVNFPHTLKFFAYNHIAQWLSHLKGYYPGHWLGFGGDEAKQVMIDLCKISLQGSFNAAKTPHNLDQRLHAMQQNVLAFAFEPDQLAPPLAVKKLLERLTNCDIRYHQLNREQMQNPALNHFNWAKKPDFLVNIAVGWIHQQRTHSSIKAAT